MSEAVCGRREQAQALRRAAPEMFAERLVDGSPVAGRGPGGDCGKEAEPWGEGRMDLCQARGQWWRASGGVVMVLV